jgi:S1-C subfamily serine protease
VTPTLIALSHDIAAATTAGAARLAAVRVGPNQHLSGIAWGDGLIVTADQALPVRDGYTVVLPGGTLAAARGVLRDPTLNLALLRLDAAGPLPPIALAPPPPVGTLVLVLGADFDATPTVRLTIVHRASRVAEYGPVLDLPDTAVEAGGLVVDSSGAMLGMITVVYGGAVVFVPHRTIASVARRVALGAAPVAAPVSVAPVVQAPRSEREERQPAPPPPPPEPVRQPAPAVRPSATGRRGWLGVALQPITVPAPLVGRAGQPSGRLVVGVSAGGPADQAGLRVGDVLLSVDGTNTSGQNALRAFLEAGRIGSKVEVRILRDTTIESVWLTIAAQP